MIGLVADEVNAIMGRMSALILASVPSSKGNSAADLRQAVGAMQAATASALITANTFVPSLKTCLDLARADGATGTTMANVRLGALAETPQSDIAVQMVDTIVRMSLAQEARIIAAVTFASRDDANVAGATLNAAFEAAAEAASDNLDAGTYMAIVQLQADVVRHLAETASLLPRVIDYTMPSVMTAHRLAQVLYSDGSRSDELIAENKVVHPAFMPRTGKMLAN